MDKLNHFDYKDGMKKLTPAQIVIDAFGGVSATARKLGRTRSSVGKWTLPINRSGTGGRIPSKARAQILELIRKENLEITSHELDYGRVAK